MKKIKLILFLIINCTILQSQILPIENGELYSSVKDKLNNVIEISNNILLLSPDTSYTKNNLFWGYDSGNDDSKAKTSENLNNTYLGVNAGGLSEIGSDNSSQGYYSLYKNKYGTRNTSVGSWSMFGHFIGNYNCSFGYQSQIASTAGYRNSTFGYKTMELNVVSYDNSFFGYKAGQIVNPTSAAITGYTDLGDGKTKVTTANSLSNGNTVYIYGTDLPESHAYTGNYDGSYVIEQVAATDYVINKTYINPDTIKTLGWWAIPEEGIANTGLGSFAGGEIEKGSYNICIGNNSQVDDPNGDYQLNIGDALKGDLQNGKLFVTGNTFGIATAKTPSSSSDTGTTGQIAWDNNYIYVCVATNTWKRTLIETW